MERGVAVHRAHACRVTDRLGFPRPRCGFDMSYLALVLDPDRGPQGIPPADGSSFGPTNQENTQNLLVFSRPLTFYMSARCRAEEGLRAYPGHPAPSPTTQPSRSKVRPGMEVEKSPSCWPLRPRGNKRRRGGGGAGAEHCPRGPTRHLDVTHPEPGRDGFTIQDDECRVARRMRR